MSLAGTSLTLFSPSCWATPSAADIWGWHAGAGVLLPLVLETEPELPGHLVLLDSQAVNKNSPAQTGMFQAWLAWQATPHEKESRRKQGR